MKNETVKFRHHYLFSQTDWKPSRTYGGGVYTLTVWKNEGVGKLRRVGTVKACTRAHKGRDHEAWTACILPDLPAPLRKRILSITPPASGANPAHYIPYASREMGLKIEEIG